MYVATMIAAPGALDPAALDAAARRWAGEGPRWLAPAEAAEFTLAAIPQDRWALWAELQSRQIDLVLQPLAGRRKKLLLADMDSTMIEQECIDELAEVAGFGPQVREITARAMNGEMDFAEALRARVGLLEGLDEAVIEQVWRERITLMPGGAQLLATMRRDGAFCALVSGGFTAFTARVAARLGFHLHRANQLEVRGGQLTGKVCGAILGRAAKLETLEELIAERGLAPADVLAVGDGANDLAMLERAGSGVALHAKPSVAARCDIRVNHGDLTALLYIQGYEKAQFQSESV